MRSVMAFDKTRFLQNLQAVLSNLVGRSWLTTVQAKRRC